MRTVSFLEFQSNPNVLTDIINILHEDGIICVPTPSGYKLMANFESSKAVVTMMQSKRRVRSAPALVLIPDSSYVSQITDSVSEDATKLMAEYWPGPVTLLFAASEDLQPKIKKALTKAKGWLGIRVPEAEVPAVVVKSFGKPLLVSSANISSKGGAESLAQVKKNFGRSISFLVEDGDIRAKRSSTLVDVTRDIPRIIRNGAITEESILNTLAG